MSHRKREYKFQNIEDFIIRSGDWAIFDAEKAIAFLLLEDEVFLNTRKYVVNDWDPKDKWDISDKSTTVIFLNCNDLFAWGCADGEELLNDDELNVEKNELYRLTSYVLVNHKWGSTKWACWKRNMQPQKPVAESMKEDGAWDDFMKSLPANGDMGK